MCSRKHPLHLKRSENCVALINRKDIWYFSKEVEFSASILLCKKDSKLIKMKYVGQFGSLLTFRILTLKWSFLTEKLAWPTCIVRKHLDRSVQGMEHCLSGLCWKNGVHFIKTTGRCYGMCISDRSVVINGLGYILYVYLLETRSLFYLSISWSTSS